jgi:hypothetical protein
MSSVLLSTGLVIYEINAFSTLLTEHYMNILSKYACASVQH